MLKKITLILTCLFLLACTNNDYGGYTRLEKPKIETVKNYNESQEGRNIGNSVLYDVATQFASDLLNLGLKLIISTIVPVE